MSGEWVVVAAGSQLDAEAMRGLLDGWGIPAQILPGDAVSFLGVSPFPCRLAVPAPRAAEARAVLDGLAQPGPGEEEV